MNLFTKHIARHRDGPDPLHECCGDPTTLFSMPLDGLGRPPTWPPVPPTDVAPGLDTGIPRPLPPENTMLPVPIAATIDLHVAAQLVQGGHKFFRDMLMPVVKHI